MSSILQYPNVTFNKSFFKSTSSRITYNGNINLDPTDEQIVALMQNDIKLLGNTLESNQQQISYLKYQNDKLIEIIKNLTNINI